MRARSSFLLTMRDGVRLAVDLHRPAGAGPVPAILRQTRYYRSLEPGALGRFGLAPPDLYKRTRARFLAAGWAWLDVDVRGSGASGGVQPYPWTPAEIADGGEVVDWIVRQPWSDGRVGSLGISYDGTCAEHLMAARHPAVRAIAPMFSLHDAYADIGFPGGIHLSWFTETWAHLNMLLDGGALGDAMAHSLWAAARAALLGSERGPRPLDRSLAAAALMGRPAFARLIRAVMGPLQRGVRRVDEDRDGRLLSAAMRDHLANESVHRLAREVTHRDDAFWKASVGGAVTIDAMSPHRAWAENGGALPGTAVLGISGWRDGGYPMAAIRRHVEHAPPGSRLVLGPWVHGGLMDVRGFRGPVPASFDYAGELLSFFDAAVRGGDGAGAPIRYYTMIEERWKTASRWPPPGFAHRPLWLEGGLLTPRRPERDCRRIDHHVQPERGSGERSRWRSLTTLVPGDYPDRAARGLDLVVHDSAPLPADLEITGHARAVVYAHVDSVDAQVFAYLEDVAPDGRVAYVTEGCLRALHRRTHGESAVPGVPARSFRSADREPHVSGPVELVVSLLPISWSFRAGHRIRLSLAGGDGDHFARAPRAPMHIFSGRSHPSRVELPVPLSASGWPA